MPPRVFPRVFWVGPISGVCPTFVWPRDSPSLRPVLRIPFAVTLTVFRGYYPSIRLTFALRVSCSGPRGTPYAFPSPPETWEQERVEQSLRYTFALLIAKRLL